MIVAELIKIQKQRGLSNNQFAESLDINRRSWLRNKRTNLISPEIALRAFEVYPEFREKWLSSSKKDTTTRPEMSCSKKLGVFSRLLRGYKGQE